MYRICNISTIIYTCLHLVDELMDRGREEEEWRREGVGGGEGRLEGKWVEGEWEGRRGVEERWGGGRRGV